MMIDAETDEAVFSNHPMFEKENVEDVLSFIEYSYEPGMIKDELKNKINETSELSYEIISKTVDTYWSENF